MKLNLSPGILIKTTLIKKNMANKSKFDVNLIFLSGPYNSLNKLNNKNKTNGIFNPYK